MLGLNGYDANLSACHPRACTPQAQTCMSGLLFHPTAAGWGGLPAPRGCPVGDSPVGRIGITPFALLASLRARMEALGASGPHTLLRLREVGLIDLVDEVGPSDRHGGGKDDIERPMSILERLVVGQRCLPQCSMAPSACYGFTRTVIWGVCGLPRVQPLGDTEVYRL